MQLRLAHFLSLVCLLLASGAVAGTLYQTDFENFTFGPNRWVGTDGWSGNSTSTGSHGIDQDIIVGGGLGKTAYLGYRQPSLANVVVSRAIPHDPVASGVPIVEFRITLGIQDSTNGRRDNFYVYFYNSLGQSLAAVGFMNNANQAINRFDGVNTTTSAANFLVGELHLLTGSINLATNSWSAELDGVPIFSSVTFCANQERPRVLGSLVFLWQIPSGFPGNFGDNWMLVGEILVRSAPKGTTPFLLNHFTRAADGTCTLAWTGQPGFDYQVGWSSDLVTWNLDLPGSRFPGRTSTGILQFSNKPAAGTLRRFYRVTRSESP
jgi:hypothetical protein